MINRKDNVMMYVTVQCDVCGDDQSDPPSLSSCVRDWREDGWRIGSRPDYYAKCPSCVDDERSDV